MTLYMVIHSPKGEEQDALQPPTRLRELAETSAQNGRSPRWLKAWSPDLNDDRIITMWDAVSAEQIRSALEEFGFLNDYDAAPLRVREWGPDDVLTEQA